LVGVHIVVVERVQSPPSKNPPDGGFLYFAMMEHSRSTDIKVIFGLTLVHFIGDFYSSFVNPLLPLFVKQFSLTLTQVGLIAGISRFFAFIVQPSVGYLADHYRTRFFVLGGPLLAIVFIPLVGIASGFLVILLVISLGSIGSSMFHPTTAGMISPHSGRRLGFSMSIFNTGGTLAFGVGPLFITYFVSTYGLRACPFTMIIGLAVMVVLFKIIPVPGGGQLGNLGFIRSIEEALGTVWRSIMLIWVVMVLRAFVSQSFLIFVAVLYSTEGYSLMSIGTVVSLFTVAGAISGLLAGHLSDRIGYKPIFYLAHGFTTPSLFLLLYLPGNWVYLSVFLAGFFAMATLPLGVAMAQEWAPKGRSMVSSLMMGLAFGLGGMMTTLTGTFADIFSIRAVLGFLTIIPLLTTGLIRLIPEKKRAYRENVI
jgi:FSR family fosmidomycin resistance protein-like MFS transporter